jgi:glycosyltransferase involved in cell wall biosynthesis
LRYAGNQNTALDRARSDYVAIVHDGDVYREDLIEKWVNALVKYPTAALVFNARGRINDAGEKLVGIEDPQFHAPLVPGRLLFDEMICSISSPIYGIVMVRKSCVKSVGQFDSGFPIQADVDMWFRLLLKYDAAYIGEVLFHVLHNEKNHINADVNWSIVEENERIHRINAKRRYPEDRFAYEQRSKQLDKLFFGHRLKILCHCVKPKRWNKIPGGIRAILSNRHGTFEDRLADTSH